MIRLHGVGSRIASEKQLREGFTRQKIFVKAFFDFFYIDVISTSLNQNS